MVERRPLLPSTADLLKLIYNIYPLSDVEETSVRELNSYEDRNFYFKGVLREQGEERVEEFVLKITQSNDVALVTDVITLINDVSTRCGSVKTPTPLKTRDGQMLYPRFTGAGGCTHCVWVVRYIPGTLLYKAKRNTSPECMFKLGQSLGHVNKALKECGCGDALKSRRLESWNLSHLLSLRPLLGDLSVGDDMLSVINKVFGWFEGEVLSCLPELESGPLHADCNDHNIICQVDAEGNVDLNHSFGIIDFSDAVTGPYIFDIGISMMYALISTNFATEHVAKLLQGFCSVFPLPKKHIGLLYYVILARCVQSWVNAQISIKNNPDNEEYISFHSGGAKKLLLEWSDVPKVIIDDIFYAVC